MPNKSKASGRFLLESLQSLRLRHSYDANELQDIIDWLVQSPHNRILFKHMRSNNTMPTREIDRQVDHTQSCRRAFMVWTQPASHSRPPLQEMSSTHNAELSIDFDWQVRHAEECFYQAVEIQRMMNSLPVYLRDVPQEMLDGIFSTNQTTLLQVHLYDNEMVVENDSPHDIRPILK